MKPALNEEISRSPLIWISTALLCGITLASNLLLPTQVWFQLVLLGLIAALVLRRLRPTWSIALILIPAIVFVGAARYQMVQPTPDLSSATFYNDIDRRIYLTGFVAEPPDKRDTFTNIRIKVTAIDIGEGDIPVSGTVLVKLTNDFSVDYGDHIRVRGELKTPVDDEEFSYRDYLALQGIHSTLLTNSITILPGTTTDRFWSLVYRVQANLAKRVYQIFPEPEASLMAGILLGADKNIPEDIQIAFKETGTAHLIAISGFNIAIISAVFLLLLSHIFGKRWGLLLAIAGIIGYTLLVGASASVVRAAIMGSLSMIGALFGRRKLALTALSAAALVMALFNPLVLWDIGFQLSFAATLGLVFYAQPLQDATQGFLERFFPTDVVARWIGPFTNYFLLTFAAQLTTLPISIYHFGQFSLVSFLANPVVLPAQPAVMILGGMAVFSSIVSATLGDLIARIAWPFAAYTIRMVEFFADLPGGSFSLEGFSLMAAIGFYVLLFGVTIWWTQFKKIASPTVVVSVLAVMAMLVWRSVVSLPDGRLHVVFLDVGSADGVLVITPNGKSVLINGGESPSVLTNQLGRRLPPFKRSLDFLLVGSTQENQVAALPRVLPQFMPEAVLWAGLDQGSFSSRQLKEWLTDNRIPVSNAEIGNAYTLDDGVTLHVLAVSNRGAVLSLEMGNFKTILPVGVDFDTFAALNNGRDLGPITALLVSESGFAPSNPPEWLMNTKPQVTILSVAGDDRNGLPSDIVVNQMKDFNLLRTDQNGWIDLATNGQQLWITTEKK